MKTFTIRHASSVVSLLLGALVALAACTTPSGGASGAPSAAPPTGDGMGASASPAAASPAPAASTDPEYPDDEYEYGG